MINLYWEEQLKGNGKQRAWMRNYKISDLEDKINFTVQCRKHPKKPWWTITTFAQHYIVHDFSLPKGIRLTDDKFNELINQKIDEEPIMLLALLNSIFDIDAIFDQ